MLPLRSLRVYRFSFSQGACGVYFSIPLLGSQKNPFWMLESFVAGDGLAHVETMDADDASGVAENVFNLDKPSLAQPRKSFIHFRGGGGEGTTSNQPIVL